MKPMRSILFVVLFALPAFGCGDDIFGTDGGTADMTMTVYRIVSGNYKVTNLTNKMDSCMIDTDPMDPILGHVFTVTNDGQSNITIAGVGTGQVLFNKGTLKLAGDYNMSGCMYHYDVTTNVTVTADNILSAAYSETWTNRTGCSVNVGTTCTSSWTMDMAKQ